MKHLGKNNQLEALQSHKWLVVMIMLVGFLCILPMVSAWNTNQFNNGLNNENLTLWANQSQIRYLEIPNSVTLITNAYLNLSGYNSTFYGRNLQIGYGTNCNRKGNQTDKNESTGVWAPITPDDACNIYENWTKSPNLNNPYFYASITNMGASTAYCWNQTAWVALGFRAGGSLPSDCTTENIIQTKVYLPGGNCFSEGGRCGLCPCYIEGYMQWQGGNSWQNYFNYTGNITNPTIKIENTQIWNYTGIFNQTNNQTNNLANIINQYLNSTYLVGSNYIIPFSFSSSIDGFLQYSDLQFSDGGFLENSQIYNPTTTESNSETLLMNLSYDSSYYTNIGASLIYNYTTYNAVKSGTGDSAIFTKTITAPSVTTDTNVSFYWNISLTNSSGTFYYTSIPHNQTVLNLGSLDDCSTYSVLLLNYTMKDERTQVVTNASNSSIELNMQLYSTDRSSLLVNMSRLYDNNNSAKVCLQYNITNNSQYSLDVQAKYSSDGYVTRYNYLQNFLLQNSTIPQHINLFDLETAYATQFLMTYKNNVFLAVPNALISINRKYVSENAFKTVEISKTDNLGQATGYFDLTGVEYQLIVSKDGVILATFDNIAIYCEDKVTGNCKLSLDAGASTSPVTDFYTYTNLAYSESFNQTTRDYQLIFYTNDNSVGNVSVRLIKFDGYYNTTICSNEVLTSSGTLTCNVPSSYKNITFSSNIYLNGNLIKTSMFTIRQSIQTSAWAGNMIIFSIGIIMVFGLLLIPSAIGVVLGTMVGVLVIFILILNGSVLGSGAFILLCIVGGLIIWRIRIGGSD